MTIDEKLDKILERLNTIPFDESGKLKEDLDKLKESNDESYESVIRRLIHFREFYMGYFDAMRRPERVRILKSDSGYNLWIELEKPYCGWDLKLENIEMPEIEAKMKELNETIELLKKTLVYNFIKENNGKVDAAKVSQELGLGFDITVSVIRALDMEKKIRFDGKRLFVMV